MLEVSSPEEIIRVCKKLLSPTTNEQAALCLGNLIIQVIHKIQPRVDTSLLMCVVQKIYKSRMPSIVQSLVLVFARLIQTNPKEIIKELSDTSIDSRINLKIVLDKWLLQQALFRGTYTRTVTISSICKMFLMGDRQIETLMVIGYNPSHSNINSEVNAPFKMLSLMLRFLENESKPTKFRPIRQPIEDYDDDDEETKGKPASRSAFGGGGAFGGFKMPRAEEELEMDSGARMDTMNDDDGGSYGSDDDYGAAAGFGNIKEGDKLSVDIEAIEDDDDDEDVIDISKDKDDKKEAGAAMGSGVGSKDAGKEMQDDENKSGGSGSDSDRAGAANQSTGGSSGNGSHGSSTGKLFDIGESKDKGLADMETGSEVYMSELLVSLNHLI